MGIGVRSVTGKGVLASLMLAGAAAVVACSDPTTFGDDGVEIRMDLAGLIVENHLDRDIYYFAVDGDMAARILWGPCDEPTECDGVAAGQRKRIPAAEVSGWGTTNTVVFNWWHLLPTDDGFRVDSIRVIVATR